MILRLTVTRVPPTHSANAICTAGQGMLRKFEYGEWKESQYISLVRFYS